MINIKPLIAELLGTFLLALVVTCMLGGAFPVPVAVMAGLALGLGVYIFGGISGAHLNPAITLGLLAIKKVTMKDAGLYIVAQLIGGALAMMVVGELLTAPTLTVGTDHMILLWEGLGAMVLALGVAAVVHGKTSQGSSGLVVGGALMLGIALAVIGGTNGMLNPAVAIATGSISLHYILGPIIGAVVGMFVYKHIAE
ncbi:MAG: hypothetical protein GC136_04860 [Alphaproteobacteria bacterium]|nr:hypothetical protein [Alphaproteobacteria bacterium]